jgi:uncharacterized protein
VTRALLAVLVLLFLGATGAPPDVPRLTGRVNDYAGILSVGARQEFGGALARYESETTHQIAVLTVSSLKDEPIEVFSLRVANAWRLGRKGLDNGVIVTIAPNERRIRIELGTGMSRYVSDAQARSVIDSMTPLFRAGNFDGALRLGLERLMDACRAYRIDRSTDVASEYRQSVSERPAGFETPRTAAAQSSR